jgi:pimeloyl-ACP methyl ester carboxylesterase
MQHDALRSGPQLRAWRTQEWLTAEDIAGPLVVLVHGLAATSAGFQSLATHLSKRYAVAVFDYVSYEGIDRGAGDLAVRLKRFAPTLTQHGFALIGHSMGGLVAKHFVRLGPADLTSAAKGLATLGSPHRAVGPGADRRAQLQWLSILIDLMEKDDQLDPFARHPKSPAAKQLLGIDEQALVLKLLEADQKDPLHLPVLTVSGGRNFIELFESGSWRNRETNRFIQLALTLPNDGLVEESSADITRCAGATHTHVRHCNDYNAWSAINHTYLVSSQDVADVLLDWLSDSVFAA